MTRKIPDAQISLISELVARHFGLHFPQERWPDLERAVCAAAEECGGHCEVESYVRELLSTTLAHEQLEVLASHLTVGETYFFREKRSLEILKGRIVPDLLRTRVRSSKQLTVWSAGCATGEEPYSVAMVLSKLVSGLKDWNIKILATDVNTKSLRKASEGIYTDWSFRDTPPWVRRTHFEATGGGRSAIVPAIKKMVSFSPLNLMDDAYPVLSNCPNGLDVIFCRNVLMYFTPEGMRKVIRQFYRYLATDGWLIVSPTETSHELFSDFSTISFDGVTHYRKSAARLPAVLTLPVCDVGGSTVQPSEQIVEATDALRIAVCQINQNARNKEASPAGAESPPASYAQALGLYEQGRYEEAEQTTFALLAQNGRDAQAMFILARIYANHGKLAEALAWCDKVIAADKMAARAHYLRATILQEQGSLPEALLALKQVVYSEPQFVLSHFDLGNLALKQQRLKESEKHFENALLLLARYEPEDIVPESEGLSAGRLRKMIAALIANRAETRTGQQRIRAAKKIGNLEFSKR
jgi:chemotaxis protein methyltransferase CheR